MIHAANFFLRLGLRIQGVPYKPVRSGLGRPVTSTTPPTSTTQPKPPPPPVDIAKRWFGIDSAVSLQTMEDPYKVAARAKANRPSANEPFGTEAKAK